MQDSKNAYNISKKPIVFAFSGKSNSGKTTLICKLCEYLHQYKIAIIKHDPKDKAMQATRGKDSYEFLQRAQAVALISPTHASLHFKHKRAQEIQAFYEALEHFKDYDYVFIEGLKSLPFIRIVVARGAIESEYIPYASAFAIDESVQNVEILPHSIPILSLNNIPQIAAFICEHSKIITKEA